MPKFLIVLVALAQGCATVTWYKDGSTESMYHQEKAQCEAGSYTVASNGSLAGSLDRTNYYLACMKGKGWRAG